MSGDDGAECWYPSVDDILLIHDDVIAEDDEASPGVRDADRIEFAIEYIEHGHFGEVPETIHEKAFHLMRLLASNHWFVDGNKRTALNATELFYLVNGYELEYGEDVRSILKLFSVRESLIDTDVGSEYLRDTATSVELDEDADPFASLVIALLALVAAYSDDDLEDHLPDDEYIPTRQEWGLTTNYDGTVNNDDDQETTENGG